MSEKLIKILISSMEKLMTTVEVSFVARIVSYDKISMTAEITPLLKTETIDKDGSTVVTESQNIKDVRVERMPGIRPIYTAGDLVKVIISASPIDGPIENDRPVDTLKHKFKLNFCTITGRVHPKTFTAPDQYSNDGLILNDDPNFYINFKSDQVYIKGKTVIDGVQEVNGNSRSLVTHAELNTALQTMLSVINTTFASKLDGGGSPGTATLDISAAKTDNIKIGAG